MKIPGYQNQGNITTAAPAARRDPRQAGMIGENIQEVGKIISRTGEQIGDIVDYRRKVAAERQRLQDETETMKAQIELTQKMNNIRLEAEKDPDIYNAPKTAREKAAKALEEAGSMVTSEQAREKFKLSAGLDNERTFYHIDTMADKKIIDARRATTLTRNDQLANEYYKENDPSMKEHLISQIILNTKQAVAQGDINHVAAKKYLTDMRKSIAIGQVDYDLGKAYQSDDFEVRIGNMITELKKGEEGGYKNLTTAERGKLIEKTQKTLKVAQNNKDVNQRINQSVVLSNIANETPESIMTQMHQGKISFDFATKIIAAKNDPNKVLKSVPESDTTIARYMETIKMALKSENPDDIKKTQEVIVKDYSKDKLKEKDVGEIAALLELSNKAPVKNAFQMLGDWIKSFGAKEQKKAMSELSQNIKDGLPPEQAPAKAKEIANRVARENNPNREKYEINQIVTLPNGRNFKITGYDDDGEPTGDYVK